MYETLFQYGRFTLTTFNVFLALAFILGVVFLVRFIRLKKLNLNFFVHNFIYFITLPLVGGRLVYILEHFSIFKQNPLRILFVWDLGLSAFGILYSTILVLYFFSKRNHEDFWTWLDGFTLSGLVGLFFIHIGHFFNGTHYGKPTDLPWGIAFDTFNIPYLTTIHPTQIYTALIIFIIFSYSIRFVKRTHLGGMAGTLAVMLYSLSAFGIDFLHGAPSTYTKINFLIIAALAFIFYIHCSYRKLFENK